MALVSMEDIALHLRGHLHAGTLNIDYINSQLHPNAQMQLQVLIDHETMEEQEEVEILQEMEETAEAHAQAAARKQARKDKRAAKGSATRKKVSKKVFSTPTRHSSRLRIHQENSPEPEFLFDLESAKDVVISPPSPSSKQPVDDDLDEIKPTIAEMESTSNQMDVDGPSLFEINMSTPVPKENNLFDIAQDILDSVDDETPNKTLISDTHATFDTIITEAKDLAISDAASTATADANDDPSSAQAGADTQSSQKSSSQLSIDTLKGSSPSLSSTQTSVTEAELLTPAANEDDMAKTPATSTRSRTRPSTKDSTGPLRKYAILNDAKKQVRIKREGSPSSTTPTQKLMRKAVPRDPNSRVMKRENWSEDTTIKRSASKSDKDVKGHSERKDVKNTKGGVGKDTQSIETASDKAQDSDDHEIQRPAKRPKLRLFLKTEPVDE